MNHLLNCEHCKKKYTENWSWIICDKCAYRVCRSCLNKHTGEYALYGGFKCSKCSPGWMRNMPPTNIIMASS